MGSIKSRSVERRGDGSLGTTIPAGLSRSVGIVSRAEWEQRGDVEGQGVAGVCRTRRAGLGGISLRFVG